MPIQFTYSNTKPDELLQQLGAIAIDLVGQIAALAADTGDDDYEFVVMVGKGKSWGTGSTIGPDAFADLIAALAPDTVKGAQAYAKKAGD